MRKIIILIFITFSIFLLSSCRSKKVENINMSTRERINLEIEWQENVDYEFIYDTNIIFVYEGIIYGIRPGITNLQIYADGKIIKNINVTVHDPNAMNKFNLSDVLYVNETITFNQVDLIVECDSDLINISDDAITILKEGFVDIKVTSKADESAQKNFHCRIVDKAKLATSALVAPNALDIREINGKEYIAGINLFDSIDAACKSMYNIIYVESTSEKEVTIRSNKTLISLGENEFNLIINIPANAGNIRIEKFTFIEDSHIHLHGGNKSIYINENKFYNLTPCDTKWERVDENSGGIIRIDDIQSSNEKIYIEYNQFVNSDDYIINAHMLNDFLCRGNLFYNFKKDAIKINRLDFLLNNDSLDIYSNVFINGEYNGIHIINYSSSSIPISTNIDIVGNHFDNVGNSEDDYVAAITFSNYIEGIVHSDVRNNIFNNCDKCIFIRNNNPESRDIYLINEDSNSKDYVVWVRVYRNMFKTIPNYYYNSLGENDNFDTNPKSAYLFENCFLDGNDNDISPSDEKIIGDTKYSYSSFKVITKKELFKLGFTDIPRVLFIGEQYDLNKFAPTEEKYFNYADGFYIPIMEGKTILHKSGGSSASLIVLIVSKYENYE